MIMHFVNIKLINHKSKKIIKLDTKINNNSKLNSNHNKNLKKEIISNSSKNILSENQIKNKSKILISIKKLEKLKDLKKYKIKKITEKNYFDKIEFSDKLKNQNKVYFDNKKKIIKFRHQIKKYYKNNIEIIKKCLYLIKMNFNKINKSILKFYISFIRFNINLLLKIKFFFILKKKKNTLNLSKISPIEDKKNKINYKYFNQENILLMSQAYLFHKIWQTRTINKHNFQNLLKNCTTNLILNEKIKNNLKEKEIFPLITFKNLKEKNLKKWLQNFNRYSISLKIWNTIATKKWKNQISHHWKERKKENIKFLKKQTEVSVLFKKKKFFYKIITNPLLEKTKKINKQNKYNSLCYSYLDFLKEKPDLIKLAKNKESIFNKEISQELKNKINIYIKSNLVLWLMPEFVEKRYITKIGKIDIPKISLLKQKKKIFKIKNHFVKENVIKLFVNGSGNQKM
jgi:hypothetical protein